METLSCEMTTDLLFDWRGHDFVCYRGSGLARLDLKKSMSMYLRAMLLRPQDTI